VFSATPPLSPAGPAARALVQVDELAERRNRVRPAAAPSISVAPASWQEHEEVRNCAVVKPERDARVRQGAGSSLSSNPEELAAARAPLHDKPARLRSDEVGDDGVDRNAHHRSRAGLPSLRRSIAGPRDRASRSSSSETVIFPIAQSERR